MPWKSTPTVLQSIQEGRPFWFVNRQTETRGGREGYKLIRKGRQDAKSQRGHAEWRRWRFTRSIGTYTCISLVDRRSYLDFICYWQRPLCEQFQDVEDMTFELSNNSLPQDVSQEPPLPAKSSSAPEISDGRSRERLDYLVTYKTIYRQVQPLYLCCLKLALLPV